jgi:hypothetical protein
MEIIDVRGSVVREAQINGGEILEIDRDELQDGVYLIRLFSPENVHELQLIVQ